MEINPRPGPRKPLKCPLCLARLDDDVIRARTCDACRVRYHAECLRELGGCATIGCAGAARATAARPDLERRRAEIYAAHEARFARRLAQREEAEDRRERLAALVSLVGFLVALSMVALIALEVLPRNPWSFGAVAAGALLCRAGFALRRADPFEESD